MMKVANIYTLQRRFVAIARQVSQNNAPCRCVRLLGLHRHHLHGQREWWRTLSYPASPSVNIGIIQQRDKFTWFDEFSCPSMLSSNAYFAKRFHGSPSCDSEKFEHLEMIESWNNVVNPFGKLSIQGPFNVHLDSLNPHEHPGMDKAFITIYARKGEGEDRTQCYDSFECDAHLSDQGKLLNIKGTRTEQPDKQGNFNQPPLECVVQVPIKFGIHVNVDERCYVNVSNLESSQIQINSNMGDCVLSNIRAGFVSVQSVGGNIWCKRNLQGNVDLKTGLNGEISGDKFQGLHIRGQTYAGPLQIQTLYGDNAIFWTNTGTVHLGSCHGNTSVDVYKGKICIDSLDGDLAAKVKMSGEVDVHLTRHEKVDISVGRGDVHLKLPDSVQTRIEMEAEDVSIDPGFKKAEVKEDKGSMRKRFSGRLGPRADKEEDATGNIKVSVLKGRITVECCDWFQSFKNSQSWKS